MLKKSEKLVSMFIDSNDFNLIESKKLEIENLQNKLNIFNQEKAKLQNKFKFVIPDYIIDEIIGTHEKKLSSNLNTLINCAVVSGELLREDAITLKQTYLY